MSRASNTSINFRRPSTASGADGGQDETPHSDEQPPPESQIVELTGGEKDMSGPSTAKQPSGISDAPSRPSKPHQNDTNNDSPNDLPHEAAGVVVQQSDLSDLKNIMNQVLDVLQDSTIASKSGKDLRSRFWTVYRKVAEEHDSDFLERYTIDMDIVLIFSGLFSAVSTSFIVAMESSLSYDPSDTTNALLTQLVQIGLGNLAAAGVEPAAPPSVWSPPTSTVRIQGIAYASLCMSLLAAFGAVLGKQWLGYYKASRYGRGSPEERGKRRQEKFDGIITWYFDAVLQSFPVLLQLSLLLFGIALSANMWYEQHSIAWVIIATTVFGFLFYSLTLMAALVSPSCPFQTPISTILCILHVDRTLRPIVKPALRYFQRLMTSVHSVLHVLHMLLWIIRVIWMLSYEVLEVAVRAVCSFAWCHLQLLFGVLHSFVLRLRSLVVHSPAQVEDSEAQSPDQTLVIAKDQSHLDLELRLISTNDLEAPSIKWLLETSTDPEVFFAAARLVPQVEWPLDLDVSDMLHQLYDIYESCVDVQSRIVPSLEEKASLCTMALSHLYFGRALQAYTGDGFLDNEISRSRRTDFELFYQMSKRCKAQDNVLALTARLSDKIFYHDLPLIKFDDSALEWLSHILPYHFVAGRVDEDVERLAIEVISRLLSPSSPPPTRIIANCTLLACVMVGVQFDKKDMVRIDKSSALNELVRALRKQFQIILWGSLDRIGVLHRVRNVICHILQLRLLESDSSQVMWNLDLYWKIYSRARSSEQNDTVTWQRVQRFRFDVFETGGWSLDSHVGVWYHRVQLRYGSHSLEEENFDWLVDYLNAVHSNDHDTACDILVLMSSMSVNRSPAKQHLFIETLIACMGSSMPYRLRHLALRTAHHFREILTSIDAVDDDADTVLTKFSPAIMSAVCPRPGATPDDGPDCLFNDERDLFYLRLVFALVRNPIWHPHLFADHHIDRCTSIIAECCQLSPRRQIYNIVGVLLRTTPEQVPMLLLESITEEQWWGMIRRAWTEIYRYGEVKDAEELLPVLVEGTKKYMHIAYTPDLQRLSEDVDRVSSIAEERALECIDDVKGLVTVVRDMLAQKFSQ